MGMNSKRRKIMCDPKDFVKYIDRQTPHSTQELDDWERSKTDNKISFKITNSRDFLLSSGKRYFQTNNIIFLILLMPHQI
jgi:hypothetical protein